MVDDGTGAQYQSLYRRYRPQRFSEVRGQDHVVMALRNAVRDDRVAHAYLFSGPRGTGKTSTARILAKALNCFAPEDGEPCSRCSSCLDIARGASLDVHELDAASNNGVDAMRDLVARASLATPGKWKVYIVDEVHMLSTAASNALLKTLEEPPSHVVFVLATTDPQKVLPTIRSRTQHYEFHLLEAEVLETLLGEIARDADLELPEGGIEAAIRRGHGSARDAVSALDQVAAAGVVEDDGRFVREITEAIVERDSGSAIRAVAAAMLAGFDAGRLGEELVDALRTIFLAAVAPGLLRHSATGLGATDDAGGTSQALLSPARCVRAMEVLGTALVAMREALDPRITLEVALVRLTDPEVDDTPAALLDRIDRLERRVAELSSQLSAHPTPPPPAPASPPSTKAPPPSVQPDSGGGSPQGGPPAPAQDAHASAGPDPGAGGGRPALGAFRTRPPGATAAGSPSTSAAAAESSVAVASPPAPAPGGGSGQERLPPSRDEVVTAWGDRVLTSLRPRVKAVYAVGRWLSVEDSTAVFALPNAAHVEHAEPSRVDVAAALSQHFGCRMDVRLETDSNPTPVESDRGDESQPTPRPASPPAEEQASRRPSARLAAAAAAAAAAAPSAEAAGTTTGSELVEDESLADTEELEPTSEAGRHDSLRWAESRLMDAFPGAEEVTS